MNYDLNPHLIQKIYSKYSIESNVKHKLINLLKKISENLWDQELGKKLFKLSDYMKRQIKMVINGLCNPFPKFKTFVLWMFVRGE